MWLLLLTAVGAALVVILTRGAFSELLQLKVTAGWLLGAGLLLQIGLEYIQLPRNEIETIGYALLMVSYGLILAFCLANFATKGFGVIAIGIAMNALVIGLNQGMPTRPIGNDAAGNRVRKPVEQTVKHRQEQSDDLLGVLGDKILFPRPFDTVVSIGDLVIAIGVFELMYYGSRRRTTIDLSGHDS